MRARRGGEFDSYAGVNVWGCRLIVGVANNTGEEKKQTRRFCGSAAHVKCLLHECAARPLPALCIKSLATAALRMAQSNF